MGENKKIKNSKNFSSLNSPVKNWSETPRSLVSLFWSKMVFFLSISGLLAVGWFFRSSRTSHTAFYTPMYTPVPGHSLGELITKTTRERGYSLQRQPLFAASSLSAKAQNPISQSQSQDQEIVISPTSSTRGPAALAKKQEGKAKNFFKKALTNCIIGCGTKEDRASVTSQPSGELLCEPRGDSTQSIETLFAALESQSQFLTPEEKLKFKKARKKYKNYITSFREAHDELEKAQGVLENTKQELIQENTLKSSAHTLELQVKDLHEKVLSERQKIVEKRRKLETKIKNVLKKSKKAAKDEQNLQTIEGLFQDLTTNPLPENPSTGSSVEDQTTEDILESSISGESEFSSTQNASAGSNISDSNVSWEEDNHLPGIPITTDSDYFAQVSELLLSYRSPNQDDTVLEATGLNKPVSDKRINYAKVIKLASGKWHTGLSDSLIAKIVQNDFRDRILNSTYDTTAEETLENLQTRQDKQLVFDIVDVIYDYHRKLHANSTTITSTSFSSTPARAESHIDSLHKNYDLISRIQKFSGQPKKLNHITLEGRSRYTIPQLVDCVLRTSNIFREKHNMSLPYIPYEIDEKTKYQLIDRVEDQNLRRELTLDSNAAQKDSSRSPTDYVDSISSSNSAKKNERGRILYFFRAERRMRKQIHHFFLKSQGGLNTVENGRVYSQLEHATMHAANDLWRVWVKKLPSLDGDIRAYGTHIKGDREHIL